MLIVFILAVRYILSYLLMLRYDQNQNLSPFVQF